MLNVEIKYCNFPTSKAAATLTSYHLFQVIQASVINTIQIFYQPIKKMYIYQVLIDKESDNMDIVPYNFDPEYWVEDKNNRQQLITKTTEQPFPLITGQQFPLSV